MPLADQALALPVAPNPAAPLMQPGQRADPLASLGLGGLGAQQTDKDLAAQMVALQESLLDLKVDGRKEKGSNHKSKKSLT